MLVAALLTFALFFGLATLTQTGAVLRETQTLLKAFEPKAPATPASQSGYIRAQTQAMR
jgi:hypothetical protein